jgi:DNA repair exonuclease SbcCD ATPase subunit
MIIKEIRFCDFLVFPGEQAMQFPTSDGNNLILILAPNNSGKTSVIRAMRFLFTGRLPETTAERLHELIHDGAKQATATNSQASAWVEITIEQEDDTICLRRTITARKVSDTMWRTGDSNLCRVVRGHKTVLQPDDHGLFQRKLWTLVPENLFDAFYFKGEPLDGKLLGNVGQIRNSLASFLHEDRWQEVEDALETVQRGYTQDLSSLMAKNAEYKKLLEEEERSLRFLRQQEKFLEDAKKKLAEAAEEYDRTDDALHQIGNAADTEDLIKKLKQARQEFEAARRHSGQADAELIRTVGNSRGLPFLLGAVPRVRRVLATMQEQNLLPADVTEGFVERVLKASQCICGRKHDEESRLHWEQYKTRALSVDLNHGLCDLLNALQEGTAHGYLNACKELQANLPTLRETRSRHIQKANELDVVVKDLEARVERSPLPDIQRLSAKMRTLAADRERLQREVTQLESGINGTRAQLKEQKQRLEKAKHKDKSSAKVEAVQQARQRAQALSSLVSESRRILGTAFHDVLQRSVTEYYDGAVYDKSRARIHYDTLLPAIEVSGQVHHNLGGGQSQLLALAYVVSLARLRKQLHEEMQALGIAFGRVYDQSFLLDSPFNHVTDNYAHAIAKFICSHARQTVLLLARHQWNAVRDILEPSASRVYGFHYSTLKEKIAKLDTDDFIYGINGKKVNLLSQLPAGGEHPRTKIMSIS